MEMSQLGEGGRSNNGKFQLSNYIECSPLARKIYKFRRPLALETCVFANLSVSTSVARCSVAQNRG